jgi:hypothetical protein
MSAKQEIETINSQIAAGIERWKQLAIEAAEEESATERERLLGIANEKRLEEERQRTIKTIQAKHTALIKKEDGKCDKAEAAVASLLAQLEKAIEAQQRTFGERLEAIGMFEQEIWQHARNNEEGYTLIRQVVPEYERERAPRLSVARHCTYYKTRFRDVLTEWLSDYHRHSITERSKSLLLLVTKE